MDALIQTMSHAQPRPCRSTVGGSPVPASMLVTLLSIALTTVAAAQQTATPVTTTRIIAHGQDELKIELGTTATLGEIEGPNHGTLDVFPSHLLYTPTDSFWTLGSDLVIFHDPASRSSTRFRIVAGTTSITGAEVVTLDGSGVGTVHWQWQTTAPYSPIEVPGTFAEAAWMLYGSAVDNVPKLVIGIEDPINGGPGTGTSTRVAADVDDLDKFRHLLPYSLLKEEEVVFYRVSDGNDPSDPSTAVVELTLRLDAQDRFWIRPRSPLDGAVAPVRLSRGQNRLRFERFAGRQGGTGAVLYLNDERVARLPIGEITETESHMLTMTGTEAGTQGVVFTLEGPTMVAGPGVSDPTTMTLFDDFGDGTPGSGWAVVGGTQAQSSAPQQLPGPGERIDFDLSELSPGSASYLEKEFQHAAFLPQGVRLGAAGYGMRFWIDTEELSLVPGTEISLVAICPPVGGCWTARVRLRRTAAGYDLVVHGMNDDHQHAASEGFPIAPGAHWVEMRMRNGSAPGVANGWLELWVDGTHAGRVDRFANHAQIPTLLRIGTLAIPGGAGGVVGLDDVETWRFD